MTDVKRRRLLPVFIMAGVAVAGLAVAGALRRAEARFPKAPALRTISIEYGRHE